MCKKSLLFLLLMAMFAPWAANAQVNIGELENATNDSYLPMNSLYEYSYTQQIYTADEIGTAGTINAITLWMYGNSNLYEMPFDIYMVETDKDAFTSTTDWVPVTAGDIVYSGSVTVHNTTAEAYTFTLPVPFTYSGTSNLLIAFDNNTGSWVSGLNGMVFSNEGDGYRSLYARQDNTPYDPTNMDGISAYGITAKRNVIEIDITPTGGGPTCERPATLEVSNITGNGATCTWESEVGNYTFEYKMASESEWTVVNNLTANTYTMSGLESFTSYNVRVKAVCGADLTSTYKTANFTTLEVCPDGLVCIGEGTATNNYLPTYFYYNYSLTEQIYTADEIGTDGAIERVDIYSVGTGTRTLEIYMVSTDKEVFEQGDWIPATANDLVFSGQVTFAANSWNTFEFENPFIYDGHNNVALIVRDMTGSYVSGIPFFVFDAPSQAIYAYRDASSYDLTTPGVSGTVLSVKNRVRFAIGVPPTCPKPTGVTAEVAGNQAVISWTSDAASFNIDINGTVIENVTNPYTFTGDLATTYEVMVQANCGGDGLSEWTNPVSFTTELCMPEDQCALTFEVTDSYGDGWNGASIDIYDYTGETLGELLASIANQNLDGLSGSTQTELEIQTITLNFCNGQELAIIWTSGSYDEEVSYTVTDLNGDVVVEGEGEGFDAFAYTINCTVTDCRRPTDFAASEIANHSVVLSWTENGPATEWVIAYISENDEEISYITTTQNPYTLTGLDPETMYAAQVTPVCDVDKPSEVIYFTTDVACPKPYNMNVTPYAYTANVEWDGYAEAYEIEWAVAPAAKHPYDEEGWYYYDNGTYAGAVGLGGGEFHWGIMLPAGSFEGTTLDIVKAYDINAMVGTLAIYNDGDTAPADQLSIQDIEFTGAGDWVEFNVGVTVNPSKNVWIVFDAVDGAAYPIGTSSDDNGDANGRWVEINGTWYDMADVGVTGRANMLRAHFVSSNYDDLEWTTVSGITSPYTIEGLQPETTYIVRVKALCGGEDGESQWTYDYFTTPSVCDMPIDLVAEDITYNSATLNWIGYQESFNVKYRQVPHGEVYASANFDDNSMGDWTTIDADGDSLTWVLASESAGVYHNEGVDLTGNGHNSSTDFIVSGSYSNYTGNALTPDNYLVSPQVTLGGSITFWAQAQDANYSAEHFGVAVSTTVNDDAAAFTTIAEWTMTAKGGDRGNVSKLVVGGGAKMEPVATTRSGENLRAGTWYQYTVDLSAYSGQGYVAIRHFDCTDQFILNVDDIVIEGVAPTIEWTTVTVTEPTLTINGLTHDTEYEWQVQGINASCGELEWTEVQTFTAGPLPTQTIALTAGYNWFSTYLDITLNDLKAALVEALPGATNIKIQGQIGATTYNGSGWRGSVTWDVNQMYMIFVNDACEISLTGMPLDPAEHSVTIHTGNNWIGFQLGESMTLTDAFAGFAANGDKVTSQADGLSTYNNGRWRGSLTNLVPGAGYIYNSNVQNDRIFIFPSSAK